MLYTLKALVVVLMIASLAFRLWRPVAIKFGDDKDFVRRRNVWIVLTIVGFVAPSFWIFLAFAVPVVVWAGAKDANPIALYVLMLHVIAPISVDIPVFGINELFSLDMYRVLSLCLLLPIFWKSRYGDITTVQRRLTVLDCLLIAFGALQALLFVLPDVPNAMYLHDSITNVLRRGFLFFVDSYLVFLVVRRFCNDQQRIAEVMSSFCLAGVIMSATAIFESLRHWLLYAEVGQDWGGDLMPQYLERGGVIRATVSAGHSLALGYLLAIAFGFWLYLRRHVDSKGRDISVLLLLVLGLLAAYSRGPWVGALAIYATFVMLGPRAILGVIKAGIVVTVVAAVLLASPLGNRIVQVIPFMGGTVDSFNLDYRDRLMERSVEMVREHPLLGDQNAYAKLNDLRQGVGVIDFVNVYADIAVFYGLIGLALFGGFLLLAIFKSYQRLTMLRNSDQDLAFVGASLVANLIGTMIMLSTSSFIFGYQVMFYVVSGLAAAYVVTSKKAKVVVSGEL